MARSVHLRIHSLGLLHMTDRQRSKGLIVSSWNIQNHSSPRNRGELQYSVAREKRNIWDSQISDIQGNQRNNFCTRTLRGKVKKKKKYIECCRVQPWECVPCSLLHVSLFHPLDPHIHPVTGRKGDCQLFSVCSGHHRFLF